MHEWERAGKLDLAQGSSDILAVPTVSSLWKDVSLLGLLCSAAKQPQGPLLLKRNATGRGTEALSRAVLGRAAVLETTSGWAPLYTSRHQTL